MGLGSKAGVEHKRRTQKHVKTAVLMVMDATHLVPEVENRMSCWATSDEW